jgi:hypothetical protein
VSATKVPPPSAVVQLSEVLDSPEIAALVSELETTRWTGRPGYPIRGLIGMALAKSLYAVPTWTRTVALVREHAARRAVITVGSRDVPSVYACYRFTAKLRAYSEILDRCIDRVTAGLSAELPEYGRSTSTNESEVPMLLTTDKLGSQADASPAAPAGDLDANSRPWRRRLPG